MAARSFQLLIAAFLLLGFSACETGSLVKFGTTDPKTPTLMRGTFRGRWWNYYQRGIAYGEARSWREAEEDLRRAVKLRGEDRRRARTYGMHFVDYFPHRELGIVYFHQGRYGEAVHELEESLRSEKSAKAEFYLDSTRKRLIQEETGPVAPPEIFLSAPDADQWVRSSSTLVTGLVKDPHYVQRITVNQQPIRLDLAAREVPFRRQVSLRPGPNPIVIEASNLAGRISRLEREVYLDVEGPTISIEEPSPASGIKSRELRVRGFIHDDAGLGDVRVNGQPISIPPGKELRLDYVVPRTSRMDRVLVEARDQVGNETRAEIPLSGGVSMGRKVVAVCGKISPLALAGDFQNGKDIIPPLIELRHWSAEQTVFLDQIYLEGSVRDEAGVAEVRLNGRPMPRWVGKSVHFSHLASLEEGDNFFRIEAWDKHGNRAEKTVHFHRRLQKVREIGSRLPVALLPLAKNRDDRGTAGDTLEELILGDLVQRGRFALVERRRLEEILQEQRLAGSALADSDKAIRVGKILTAGGVLMGTVLEKGESVEVFLRLVDTETSLIIAAVDVYGEETDLQSLHQLSQGLVLKLCDEVPLLEGTVLQVKDGRLTVDLGKDSRLKKGMRVVVFREGEPIRHPLSGALLGVDVEVLGWGQVQAVQEQVSHVELDRGDSSRIIEPLQKILTQ